MDSNEKILQNMREVVGCTGLRNFTDLRRMRQDTLEKRMTAASPNLSTDSMVSIYASWMVGQALDLTGGKKKDTIFRWIGYISHAGCGQSKAECVWDACVDEVLDCTRHEEVGPVMDQMDEVRNIMSCYYPRPFEYSGSKEFPIVGLDTPVAKALDTTPSPKARSQLSESPPLSLKRKNIFSLTLALRGNSHNPPAETTSPEFVNLGRLSGTISPVPKNYPCKGCGTKGHLVKDCPENPGPAFDLPPDVDYVCHLCGAEGDHYIYSCYKYNYKSASATPPSRKRPAPVDDDDEVPRRIFSREAREGRLSPWEDSSNRDFKSSAESSPSIKGAEKKAVKPRAIPFDQPNGLSGNRYYESCPMGWLVQPQQPQAIHRPTTDHDVSAFG
ncbi:hypothetical protein BKA56DRAFT_151411 [Ilyonectria sp. MPI-CAGE-AT-0026]|nr:hypothetical protein BKA56DRAFT_151411 [Ilyonectria sp. MPI-CAGE-AT-0026]